MAQPQEVECVAGPPVWLRRTGVFGSMQAEGQPRTCPAVRMHSQRQSAVAAHDLASKKRGYRNVPVPGG